MGGGQKVYVEKVYVLFLSFNKTNSFLRSIALRFMLRQPLMDHLHRGSKVGAATLQNEVWVSMVYSIFRRIRKSTPFGPHPLVPSLTCLEPQPPRCFSALSCVVVVLGTNRCSAVTQHDRPLVHQTGFLGKVSCWTFRRQPLKLPLKHPPFRHQCSSWWGGGEEI